MKKVSLFILLVMFLAGVHAVQAGVPAILDTDIGDDIDDTWALSLLLCSPELDLKLVVTDYNDTVAKAKLTAKFLESVGRADVEVGIGKMIKDAPGPQYEWSKDYDLKKYPGTVHEDGIQAMIDTIRAAKETVTLFVLGPCPNIKIMLDRAPDVVDKVKVFAMSGSVYRGYNDLSSPDAEYNVREDIAASKALYTAGWDLTIAPLDTAGTVVVKDKAYQTLMQSDKKVVKTLLENYRVWAQTPDRKGMDTDSYSSTLFDTVAVYLAYSDETLEVQDINLVVDDKGYTVVDPKGKTVHTAVKWKNLDGYVDHLVQRLCNGVINEKSPEEPKKAPR